MHLIVSNDIKALSKLFLKRMEFGTAGLRGRMGPGFSQMNDLVIIQTGQGLVKYLTQALNNVADKGVIIGYDGRYNSKRFVWRKSLCDEATLYIYHHHELIKSISFSLVDLQS